MSSQPQPADVEREVWWSPVRRGHTVIGVVAALAPTDQIAVMWPSRTPDRPANLWAVGALADLADVHIDGPPLTLMDPPRFFGVVRRAETGAVSGTGMVAVCVEIRPLGTVALAWIGQAAGHQTLTRLPSLRAVYDIHGHHGATELVPLPGQLVHPAPHPFPRGQAGRG